MKTSRGVLTALSLLAAVPAAAIAADGVLFGGGGKAPAVGQPDQFVALDRAKSGKKADFYVSFELPGCRTAVIEVFKADVDADGRFSKKGPYKTSFGIESHDGTYSFKGRFTGGTVKGSARFDFEQTVDGETNSCSTGKVRWTANAPRADGMSGKLKAGASYGGYTEQRSDFADLNLPVRLTVSDNKKKVERLSLLANASCRDDEFDASGPFLARGVKIKDGAWDDGGTFTVDRGNHQLEYFIENRGRFGKRKVKGVWTLSAIVMRDGQEVSRCGGEPLKWQAAR